MPLLGTAAMLLAFDVAGEAVAEHDDWHTHEHLPERLSIPGFLRGTRWIARGEGPRYFVLYEVDSLDVLSSAPYLERLNAPSAWTSRTMPHYRGMRRGFCSVSASFGLGTGHAGMLLRLKPQAGAEASLRRWLKDEALPGLPAVPGIGGAHLLEGAATPAMTNEQRIRGADAGVDWAIVLTGYREDALAQAVQGELGRDLERHAARDVVAAAYRLDYVLTQGEVDAQAASP